jgi:hypothetical protein
MRKLIFSILFISFAGMASGQDFGLSFSYFIPKNGYFSTPISPFSIRGLGFNIGDYLGVQTGASLYRMSGLNAIDMAFESKDPVLGPSFTLMVPLEGVFQIGNNGWEFSIKGGGFAFYSFDQKINYGNLDKAIRKHEGWDIANSDASIDNKLGLGYMFGIEYLVYITKQIGISLEGNYYIGGADLGLRGSYNGAALGGTVPSTPTVFDYKDSKVDFTGLEISIGIIYSAN